MFFTQPIMLYNIKTKAIVVIFVLFFSDNVIGQSNNNRSIDPIIKSFLVPGWGQIELGCKNRSKTYTYIEIGLLLSMYSSIKYSNELKRNYIAYASEHADISTDGKDHEFWVDIGNYNTLNDYNDEHLRNREAGDLYPSNSQWSWNWDSPDNRKHFELKRIQSDKLKLFSTFTIGGLFLNHFISSIDALYLKRLLSSNKFSIKPYFHNNDMVLGYKIDFKF